MKVIRLFAGAGLLLVALLAGCSSSSAGGGAHLLIGTDEGIDTLNPLNGLSQDSFNAWEQIYPQLVQYNPTTLAFVPDFARSWSESPNGLTWTFHTVTGAKWSDGQPLTASDAAWTFNTVIKFQSGATATLAGGVTNMKDAVATGSTLVVKYSRPTANVLAALQQLPILPEHVWGRYAVGNGAGLKTFSNKPTPGHPVVSGGPFECTKFVFNQEAIFQRNKYFYGPKPHISGFALVVYSNDDAMVEALKTGQIDAIENVPVTSVKAIKAAGFDLFVGPSLTWRDFIINPNPKKVSHRELLNPLVREAFEYAINRQAIVHTAWLGYATPAASAIPPSTGVWHDPAIHPLPFDLSKANQLLNEAGYKMGANGVRIANGHPMSYRVIFSSDQSGPGERAFQIIKTDFAKIGVTLTQQTLDPAATTTAIEADNYRKYDLAMWWWVPLIDPNLMTSAYTCSQFGGWNDSGYCNPVLDKIYEEQASTLNHQKRVQLIYKAQQIIYNSRSEIALVYNDTIFASNKDWTGFTESPGGFFNQFSKINLEQVRSK